MLYLKSLPPTKSPAVTWTYNRWGTIIPKEEIEIKSLKIFFVGSPLSEDKLLNALRNDDRVFIETEQDREARLSREKVEHDNDPVIQHEIKTIKKDKKRNIQKKIDAFNEEKENAQATATKEDDEIVAKKEKELMNDIKEVENDSE